MNIMQFEPSLFDVLANRIVFDINLFDTSMKRGVLGEDNTAIVITEKGVVASWGNSSSSKRV